MEKLEVVVPVWEMSDKMEVTIRISGMRLWSMRMRVAALLVRLAAWLAPIRTTVEVER